MIYLKENEVLTARYDETGPVRWLIGDIEIEELRGVPEVTFDGNRVIPMLGPPLEKPKSRLNLKF